jgi:cyanate permease
MLLAFAALAALAALTLPLIEGQQYGWPSWCFILLASAALLFVVFWRWEVRTKRSHSAPLVDFGLFRERSFAVGLGGRLHCR